MKIKRFKYNSVVIDLDKKKVKKLSKTKHIEQAIFNYTVDLITDYLEDLHKKKSLTDQEIKELLDIV